MEILGCQLDIAWEDKAANLAAAGSILAADVPAGALVVLPEMFSTGFSMNVAGIAEGPDGPGHAFLAETARRYQAYVIGGVVTRAADGKGRNEAVCYDPAGSEIARYAKLHPFGFAGETAHYAAGDEVVTFRVGGDPGQIVAAPLICYDLRFPEAFRLAVRRGAELFLVIANIVLTLLFSSLVAYAFARLTWPGRDIWYHADQLRLRRPHRPSVRRKASGRAGQTPSRRSRVSSPSGRQAQSPRSKGLWSRRA